MDVHTGPTVGRDRASEWFDEFYASNFDPMVRLAFVLLNDASAAEDVAQQAFIVVFERRDRVEKPLAYLRSTVYNLSRKHHRRAAVRRRFVASTASTTTPVHDHVIDAVRRLPQRQRGVVVLRFYLGLTYAEIAAVLGLRLGTVKSTLHRAVAALREELE